MGLRSPVSSTKPHNTSLDKTRSAPLRTGDKRKRHRQTNMMKHLFTPWRSLSVHSDSAWYGIFYNACFFLALLFFGLSTALVILEPWKTVAEPVDRIAIGRLELRTGRARPDELVALARGRLQSPLTLTGGDFVHRTNWANLGAGVDMPMLGRVMVDLARKDSPSARYFREEAVDGETPEIPLPIRLNSEAAVEALLAIKDSLDWVPKDAVFDFEKGIVVEEEPGLLLDVYGTLARLDKALRDGVQEVELVVEETPANILKTQLENIEVDMTVGFFETRFSRLPKDKDRTYNVKLGASMLNGHVIMPQQVFSFNDVVGDRNEARGFRYAPVIAGGEIVEGMGGGTCQVASTLYAASFFSGLVTVDRRPHSRPSAYIKLGIDATVSYPNIDLKLKNPFDFPIVIRFSSDDGVLRAEFKGKTRPYTVTLLRRVIDAKPYPVSVIDDPNLEAKTEVITQNGIPGYSVRRFQIIERNKVAYRFLTIDNYPPTTQVVRRGTAPPGTIESSDSAPKADTHSPYRASEHLRMVQGANDLWYEQTH